MLQQFQQHIGHKFPFLNEKKLIIAISGGVDSVVLTHLLHQSGFHIVLAHCNFKLRAAESDEDEAFVVKLAKKLSIAVYTQSFDTETYATTHKVSVQMAARDLRYRWFASLISTLNYHYLLTAHHADDDLETFLINLSRGTGLEGLSGIPGQNRHIIRPLLPFSKEDILNYARENNLAWCKDSSNTSVKYLRNQIRHNIIPELKTLHPTFLKNFQKTLQHLSGSKQILHQHIAACKATLFQQENNMYKISVAKLAALSPRKAYLHELFKDFGFTEWDNVAHMLHAPSGKQLFSATHRLLKDRDYIYIEVISTEKNIAETIIHENTHSISSPIPIIITETDQITDTASHIIYVDKEKLKFPLTVRKWKKGDYFYPFGMQGKKKLSKFFKDEKYALFAKENQWLLCSGDDIIWIIGKRADNRYGIDRNTGKILKIKTQQ